MKCITDNDMSVCDDKDCYLLFYFTASWCGPCKRITPLVNDLFSKMPQNVYMLIIDIDKAKDIASYLKVRSVPMLCNYISNEPMDSVVGANEEKVINFFKKTAIHAVS